MAIPTQDPGRRIPPDFDHVDLYPIRLALADPESEIGIKPVPLSLGVYWYPSFDRWVTLGRRSWIGVDDRGRVLKDLGRPRGGHCVCIQAPQYQDYTAWWEYYNQGNEGACVGFGSTRMMSLLNRMMYNPWWLYWEAQKIDPWSDTPPGEGTDVNSAMKILRERGHVRGRPGPIFNEKPEHGIAAYRWATKVDEVLACLQSPLVEKIGAVPILNSWGRDYPHRVWMPFEILQVLLDRDGECAIITDR